MSLREWANNNSTIAIGATVALLVLALAAVFWQGGGRVSPAGAYFYDPGADAFFVGSATDAPPIRTPSGSQDGVRAWIYACGECPDSLDRMSREALAETNAFVSHFERYTDTAKRVLAGEATNGDAQGDPDQVVAEGLLVRAPDNEQWHPAHSDEGVAVTQGQIGRCEAQGLSRTLCRP